MFAITILTAHKQMPLYSEQRTATHAETAVVHTNSHHKQKSESTINHAYKWIITVHPWLSEPRLSEP